MASATSQIPEGLFTTDRRDKWWFFPGTAGLAIIIFGLYTGLAIFVGGENFKYGHYLSPMFGPEVPQSFLNAINWPSTLPLSYTALLLIWAPFGFRATCYYARKVYYRSFFGNPPACAVDGYPVLRGKYKGEYRFPFILSNLHRYFLYFAIILALIHWTEVISAFRFDEGIGIGVGTILIFADAFFLSLYVLSCHAFRHLIGGGKECFSCSGINKTQYKGWKFVSRLNERHGLWFWISITTVILADLYIRLLNANVISDLHFVFFK